MRLSWSDTSKRTYETGLDRGVLYPKNVPPGPVDAVNRAIDPSLELLGGTNNDATRYANPVADTTIKFEGTRSLRQNRLAANAGQDLSSVLLTGYPHTSPYIIPVTPGEYISFSIKGSCTVANALAYVSYAFINNADALLAAANSAAFPMGAAGSWTTAKVENVLVPAGSTYLAITGLSYGPGGYVSTGVEKTYWDAVMVNTGATVKPYFSGATEDQLYTYEWNGTPNQSTSNRRPIVGKAIPWVGLTGVDESGADGAAAYYVDGRPFLFLPKPKEYQANLKAYTYPDEFAQIMGQVEATDGMFLDSQQGDAFDLSYRTLIGNMAEGDSAGYKIHLVYNATVAPAGVSYSTQGQSINPSEFSWDIQAVPTPVTGYRATAHVTIDTRHMSADKLAAIEELIYGSDTVAPSMPSAQDVFDLLKYGDTIVITDNGDGTWTAEGSYHNIYLIGDGIFEIDNVNAVDHGDGTYDISSTP